jgi:hypothetical protein
MPKKLTLQTDAEIIRNYLIGDIPNAELSPCLEEKLQRINHTRQLVSNYVPKHKVIEQLINDFGINRNQAYNLYYETTVVYDERQIRIEKAFENIKNTRIVAQQKMDGKALAACDRNEINAIMTFYGDKETATYDSLQPPAVTVLFEPELINPHQLPQDSIEAFVKMMQEKYQHLGTTNSLLPPTIEEASFEAL